MKSTLKRAALLLIAVVLVMSTFTMPTTVAQAQGNPPPDVNVEAGPGGPVMRLQYKVVAGYAFFEIQQKFFAIRPTAVVFRNAKDVKIGAVKFDGPWACSVTSGWCTSASFKLPSVWKACPVMKSVAIGSSSPLFELDGTGCYVRTKHAWFTGESVILYNQASAHPAQSQVFVGIQYGPKQPIGISPNNCVKQLDNFFTCVWKPIKKVYKWHVLVKAAGADNDIWPTNPKLFDSWYWSYPVTFNGTELVNLNW